MVQDDFMAFRQDVREVRGPGKCAECAIGGPLLASPPAKPRSREEEVKLFGQLMAAIRTLDVDGVRTAVSAGAKLDGRDERGRRPLFLVREMDDSLDHAFAEIGRRSGGGVVDAVLVAVDPEPGREPATLPKLGTILGEMEKLDKIRDILEHHGAAE